MQSVRAARPSGGDHAKEARSGRATEWLGQDPSIGSQSVVVVAPEILVGAGSARTRAPKAAIRHVAHEAAEAALPSSRRFLALEPLWIRFMPASQRSGSVARWA